MTAAATAAEEAHTLHSFNVSRTLSPVPDGGLAEEDAAWPSRLRRLVREALADWGCPGLIEDAELLVTELTTNALRHGNNNDIYVRGQLQDGHLTIEVNDGSPTRPKPRRAEPHNENGRGLWLVESLADSWGVSPDGTTTWCLISQNEGLTPCDPSR